MKGILLAGLMILALTGCGGSSSSANSGGTSGNGGTPYELTTLKVSPASFTPGTPSFSITFNVDNPNSPYDIHFFLSADDTLSTSDTEILTGECGALDDDCGANMHPVTVDCDYTNSLELSCAGTAPIDLSTFLTTIPKDAFLIVKTCDITSINCTQPVTRQITFN